METAHSNRTTRHAERNQIRALPVAVRQFAKGKTTRSKRESQFLGSGGGSRPVAGTGAGHGGKQKNGGRA